MSTSLVSKPLTVTQRAAEAAHKAAACLHADDEKRMLAAMAEIAAEEIERNPTFALRVRNRHAELAPAKPSRSATTKSRAAAQAKPRRSAKTPKKTLIPIKQIDDREINVARALDPYFLLEVYGAHQLRDALEDQTAANLREAVTIVKERNPGTRPAGTSAIAMIEYIVKRVLG